MSMETKTTVVAYLNTVVSRATYPVPPRTQVVLMTADGNHTIYRSKPCDTEEEARKLCARYLERNPTLVLKEWY